MAAKIPVRAVFDGSTATGLSEFQSTEFIALAYGGLGASLSIGSAGQVLKVNAGADALEFGAVEAVLNIDGMTDGSGITIADGDKFAISDGGTEKYVLASQIKSYVVGAGATDITALDIDGATDIGAAIASGDLFIIDDGAGGTNRKTAASRIKTYVADVTLTTAAQSNITSLGTLTTLTVDNIIVNGTNIGHTSDTDAIAIASDGKVTFTQEVIAPSLDISGDVDVDGTLETDALTIGGTTLAETIADTVGAMVTSNTETGITVTYEDGDNTLDFVIGTLNQNTTGNAATATALETARTIGGTSFDGTANIAVSLAATATALASARTIGGVSFDGTGNINLPGVNAAGNQDTTGTASKVTVADSTANTNFPVIFHDESNALLDDTGALRYNPSTGTLLVPNLTVAGTTTQVDTVTMEAANAVIFEGATADAYETTLSIVDPTADRTQYLINQGGYIPVLAASTTTAITSTPAELNILDGVTSTAAELNTIDGDTSATGTTLVDADRVVVNDAGTMKQVALSDFETYFESGLDTLSSVTTVGALDSGSITSGFGTIDTGSSTITTTGVVTAGGFTIGSAAILEAELEILDGANVTTDELNLLDGSAKSTSSITIADTDAFIVIDGTTTKQIPASNIVTYASTTADVNAIAFAVALG